MLKSHFNLATPDEEEKTEEMSQEEDVEAELAVAAAHEQETVFHADRKLSKSEVSIRLSMLGLTADGDGYTYLKAKCTGMRLTDITAIQSFKHLQFLDFSDNNLDLAALQVVTNLPFLILIHADKNQLNSAALKKMKYLQVIIMNDNFLTSVHDVYQPELSTLEVGFNKIQKIYFENRMPTIRCLDFRNNLIQDIVDLDFPKLDSLYLAGNKIRSLVGLERLVNLRILHVRNNPIKSLNGFDAALARLQYINLRNCKVSSLKQVRKLAVLPSLETLILRGCPYMGGTGVEEDVKEEEDETELRVEILAALPRLKRINKGLISPEERHEAKDLMVQWIEEGVKDDEEDLEETQEEQSNHESQ